MMPATVQSTIVVTGGAGYIGSHIALLFLHQGYNVIVLDTFKHRQHMPHPFEIRSLTQLRRAREGFEQLDNECISVLMVDFSDRATLSEIFETNNVVAVVHCAGLIEVGESVRAPRAFYTNNVIKTCALLETMVDHGVHNCIFSSSCAVYGNPQSLPLTEEHPTNPASPYGNTKRAVEMMLNDFSQAYNLRYVALRYFNAAGAMPEFGLGEQHLPESHIIPLLLRAAHEKTPFTIFGNNYDTHDGTCIRDYVHVWDIAQAHRQALDYLLNGGASDVFNLGTGTGASVQEIITSVEKTCFSKIKTAHAPRRAGDPAVLVANAAKAVAVLGWQPHNSALNTIISSANSFYTGCLTTTYANKRTRSHQL